MNELKITIDQLKNYLGTGLQIVYGDKNQFKSFLGRSGMQGNIDIHSAIDLESKPIVYRLSDLDTEIEVNGKRFVPIGLLLNKGWSYHQLCLISKDNSVERASFDLLKKLFEWHFWPFGDEYFDQGLVIDKMTVK